MVRSSLSALIGLMVLAAPLAAQDTIRKGVIKKVDAVRGTLTVTVDGADHELTLSDESQVWDAAMRPIAERLKHAAFKPGAAVMFKAEKRDGKLVVIGLKLGGENQPPPGIQKARIKKVDVDRMVLTLTVEGKDQEFAVTDKTRVPGDPEGGAQKQIKDGKLKAGAEVFFKAEEQDGKQVLAGVKLVDPGGGAPPRTIERVDTSRLRPLPELGTARYQEYEGGLYPGGKNEPPEAHAALGLARARKVQPLDELGKPSPTGKMVLLSIGMSNTTQAFSTFMQLAKDDPAKNPRLVLVDGAQGGMAARQIIDPDDRGPGTRFWTTVDQRLKAAGVARAQVQAVWIKQADAGPTQGFPGYARRLQQHLAQIVHILDERFPNLQLVYLSSRTYAGYARTPLNPEPYAFESAFSVKWLIEQQLKGEVDFNCDPAKGAVKAPWLGWGPYLWANGTTKRADGFSYEEADFSSDGTHPSASGRRKVAELLLKFFKTDPTARSWFTGS
jgi:hypothetical protein